MGLEIYWTDFSKKELKNIFDYYKEEASLNVARNVVLGITKEAAKLKKNPTIGQEEELLDKDSRDFRYLVFKNYKIIYWVNLEKNRIEVFDIFDTRQNPTKIKRTK
ncbi:type II toxin-antitoxin system RelE/ParE family toxin [Flavobacterium sp. LM4]|uniref:type II toxin-antitoxin system RelE/ParE family toxin n=1 Tax=Flavobacterium sp. LM4 TaxID=1938609 RepID=UPI000993AFA8|nr:type II toxin-antitoxin system RelE/ParE family toxin [Flavobacterium sp. LM4]OOV18605.1 plasmid stabilization protein [Flavobacterium sp. LM4]